MGDLTPFQNQVLDAAQAKEAEEKEKAKEEARQQNAPSRNSRSGGQPGPQSDSTMEQEETVRYVNEELNPDHEVH